MVAGAVNEAPSAGEEIDTTGGRSAGAVWVTTSESAVTSVAVVALRLVTAIPTYTVSAIGTESEPIGVHVFPSDDWYAVSRNPERVRRTHPGGVDGLPAVPRLVPPVTGRR